MFQRKRPYAIALIVFAFLAALSVLLLLIVVLTGNEGDRATTGNPLGQGSENQTLVVVSMLTSLTSLIGFVSTTLLNWREEIREAKAAALEQQRQELELEKLRLELAQARRETSG